MEKKHRVKTVCKFCRQEFYSFGLRKICPQCDSTIDESFRIIRDYIEQYPDAGIGEICDALNINTNLVKYFLREERLRIKQTQNNYFLKCLRCDKPIYTGRYCFECEIIVERDQMKGTAMYNDDYNTEDVLRVTKRAAAFHSARKKN